MNKAKKIIATLICIILCFSFCPTVFAAESNAVITLSNKSAMPGDSVTVDIDISNNPGIMAMAFCVTYDNNSFEFTDYTNGIISGPTYKNHEDKGHIAFVYVGNSDKADNGTLLSVTFKIKNTAKSGKHIITLANSNRDKYGYKLHNSFSNSKQQFIVPTVKSGSITVGETCENSGHKYGEWTVTKEADCTKTGLKNHTCSRCKHFEEVEIPITHDFEDDWTVDKAATPTEDGIMSRHCKLCDAVTDKITFTYKEVEDSQKPDDNTSSDNSTFGDDSSNENNNSSSDTSSDIVSDENSSDATVSNNSSTTPSPNKTPINNTVGSKNPQSAVENTKDYQDNIKPNLENNSTSSILENTDSQDETASNNSSSPANTNTDGSTSTNADDDYTDIEKGGLSTTQALTIVIGAALSAAIIVLAVILIVKRKKAE